MRPLSVISFNINGISPSSSTTIKVRNLSQIVRRNHVAVVVLQETHHDISHPHFNILLNWFPHFVWFTSSPPSIGWGGLAIGIRSSVLGVGPPLVEQCPDASSLAVSFLGRLGQPFTVVSSYRNPRHTPHFLESLSRFTIKGSLIWGGDINSAPLSPTFNRVSSWIDSHGASIKIPSSATFSSGSIIDFLAIPSSWPAEVGFVVCPILLQDHAPLLYLRNQRSSTSSHPKSRIPASVFKSAAFHSRFRPNPTLSLQATLIEARLLAENILGESLSLGVRTLITLLIRLLRKGHWDIQSLQTTPEFTEITSDLLDRNGSPLVPWPHFKRRVLLRLNSRIEDLVIHSSSPPVHFFTGQPSAPRPFVPRPPICVIDPSSGVPVSSPAEVRRVVESFWIPVFSTHRPYSKIALNSLLRHVYPDPPPPQAPSFTFNSRQLKRVIKSLGRSAAGPDGIPFSFFKQFRKLTKPHIKSLLFSITSPTFSDPDFCEAYISLIPKDKGACPPSGLRPITVTNSIYRIVGKYLTEDFIAFISPLVSEWQHAILPGRSSAKYLVSVRDRFLELIHSSSPVGLLQTDFAKAYDFLNREAIVALLLYLHTPPFLLHYIVNILKHSRAYISVSGSRPSWFNVVTGVRQGCPISPYLFIFVYDSFLRLVAPSPHIITLGGYMDDCTILFSSLIFLLSLLDIIRWYEKAFGGLFSHPKCRVICHLISVESSWAQACLTSSTTVLGVPTGTNLTLPDVWAPTLESCFDVASSIGHMRLPLSAHIRVINSFLVSKLGYLSRFVYLPKQVASRFALCIRRALGPHNSIPSSLLYSNRPPFSFPTRLRHCVFQAISLAASLPPSLFPSSLPRSPISTNFARMVSCLEVSASLPFSLGFPRFLTSQEDHNILKENLPRPVSHHIYKHLVMSLPSFVPRHVPSHLVSLIHANLVHPFPDHLRITFLRFLSHSWHFHAIRQECPWCSALIDYSHIPLCPFLISTFSLPSLQIPTLLPLFLPFNDSSCILAFHPPDFRLATLVLSFLHLIRSSLLQSIHGDQLTARSIFKSTWIGLCRNLRLPLPPLYSHISSPLPPPSLPFSFPTKFPIPAKFLFYGPSKPYVTLSSFTPPSGQYTVFFDGSARSAPPIAGAGSVTYSPEGLSEGLCVSLPLCSSNQAEAYAALLGLSSIFPFARHRRVQVNIVGDSEIILKGCSGEGFISDPLLSIPVGLVRWLVSHLQRVRFIKVPRDSNKSADALAYSASSQFFPIAQSSSPPPIARADLPSCPIPHISTFHFPSAPIPPSSFFSFPSLTLHRRPYPSNAPCGIIYSSPTPTLTTPLNLPLNPVPCDPLSITTPLPKIPSPNSLFLSHIPPSSPSTGFP